MDSLDCAFDKEDVINDFHTYFYNDPKFQPLVKAIYANHLDTFCRLIRAEGASSNYHEFFRYCMIKFLIWTGRLEMFKSYIFFDLKSCSYHDQGKTILMDLTTLNKEGKEEFAKAFIAAGANVNEIDGGGNTLLHFAARERMIDNTKLVELMIEHGADINARNDGWQTPLWMACSTKNYSFLHMMLYHGADATIPDYMGILPLVKRIDKVHQDILFDYTFDEKTTVSLSTLTQAMCIDTDLFNRILEMTEDISFGRFTLADFKNYLRQYIPEHIKLLFKNFPGVVEVLNTSTPFCEPLLVTLLRDCKKDVIDAFLQDTHCVELIQAVQSPHSLIPDLLKNLKREEEDLTEIIYVLLSYGLEVTSDDLDTIYENYGFCELFRIMLHMDITILKEGVDVSPARVYYDLNCNIDNFARDPLQGFPLLEYYNNYKLKEACLRVKVKEFADKVNMLPSVPSLLELSRNATRKHLVNRYTIENSRQFYTVLKWFPIQENFKEILLLEKKLY